jgi:hypothetical protein
MITSISAIILVSQVALAMHMWTPVPLTGFVAGACLLMFAAVEVLPRFAGTRA